MQIPHQPSVNPVAPVEALDPRQDPLPKPGDEVQDEPVDQLDAGIGLLLAQLMPRPQPLTLSLVPPKPSRDGPVPAAMPPLHGLVDRPDRLARRDLPDLTGTAVPRPPVLPAAPTPRLPVTSAAPTPTETTGSHAVERAVGLALPTTALPTAPSSLVPPAVIMPANALSVMSPANAVASAELAVAPLPSGDPEAAPAPSEAPTVALPALSPRVLTVPVPLVAATQASPTPAAPPLPVIAPAAVAADPAYLQVPFNNGKVEGQIVVSRVAGDLPAVSQPLALQLAPSSSELSSHLRTHLDRLDTPWSLREERGHGEQAPSQGQQEEPEEEHAAGLALAADKPRSGWRA